MRVKRHVAVSEAAGGASPREAWPASLRRIDSSQQPLPSRPGLEEVNQTSSTISGDKTPACLPVCFSSPGVVATG